MGDGTTGTGESVSPSRQADRSSTAIPGVVTSKESLLAGDVGALPRGEHRGMVIALLAVLGVDLVVIVVVLGVLLSRRRWVSHQPDAFKGAIRVVDGEVSGLGAKWQRGYGRWVRDVRVWTKAPALFRNELVAVDGLAGEARAAELGGEAGRERSRDRAAGRRWRRAGRGGRGRR